MNVPQENISKIIIFHRQKGRNFVLYVLGIQDQNGICEELSSSFYPDLKTLKTDASSMVRFIQLLGFRLEHKTQADDTLTFLKDQRSMNT